MEGRRWGRRAIPGRLQCRPERALQVGYEEIRMRGRVPPPENGGALSEWRRRDAVNVAAGTNTIAYNTVLKAWALCGEEGDGTSQDWRFLLCEKLNNHRR